MKYINAAGFVVDRYEILWLCPNTDNAGGGYTVNLRNGTVIKVNTEQGEALAAVLTEPEPVSPSMEVLRKYVLENK